ncbi:putative transcriptional regulator of adherence protein [Clavispora lusitaniae]|uniref:Transcriptional regulator of adherence protein n=1 Tax=Clavispora lusitaniae TaxID=36911 RepID=A0ACD0WQC2_CLALS|nr:SPX domain family protein [Clavispora lusitaniae]QFZ29333.1 putative transcriptional regulator of adherence protein [Clavispora lusitaniae]QFZ34996.1 putative transcriptional regulator of adherence protein [Clavispora lusitaniae]QFZ40681.1 putative transcriptional regulator of adherence protein [Clavispora lusitaniae]QFZ46361.1 putative transcriptional regulator of adherence protein [Clavispora lusitaniae]
MKFAKVLQQTLVEENLPETWVEAAIQYKMLKKYISKVVEELQFVGLTNTDLKLLLQNEDQKKTVELDREEASPTNPIMAKYMLTKSRGSNRIVPYLKIVLNDTDKQSYTQDHIQELAQEIREKVEKAMSTDDEDQHVMEIREQEDGLVLSPTHSRNNEELVKVQNNNEIVIMLKSDSKFFRMLNAELANLDEIRQSEEKTLITEVEQIGEIVHSLTQKRADLYKWRELFRIYLDSEVFFRYNETSRSQLERSSDQIKRNLQEFTDRVQKTDILDTFKQKKSLVAYHQFVKTNERLLKIMQFQSINTTALRKILKKFDKRTSLNISTKFPDLISQDHIFITGSSLAQSICFLMQHRLLTLVPQLEDYSCPICMSIAYKPIRLECGHIFCVRCLVKMKKRGKTDCPLCRCQEAILKADSSNLDLEIMDLIQRFFPMEVKEKMKEIKDEKYKEVVGEHKNCVIM